MNHHVRQNMWLYSRIGQQCTRGMSAQKAICWPDTNLTALHLPALIGKKRQQLGFGGSLRARVLGTMPTSVTSRTGPPCRRGYLIGQSLHRQNVHTAVIFIRGRWTQEPTALVGHAGNTLAAAFSPVIYRKLSDDSVRRTSPQPQDVTVGFSDAGAHTIDSSQSKQAAPAHNVVAVAGQDRVLTVWPGAARPVAILREIFRKPPSDLSWGADGYTLLASGHDGTVAVMRFTPEEVGVPLPKVVSGSSIFSGAAIGILLN